jgi:hypothetical protein
VILIRPKAIDNAALAATNIDEMPPAAWASGTTYAEGAVAAVFPVPLFANNYSEVVELDGGAHTIEKISGGFGWVADAVSHVGLTGDFVLRLANVNLMDGWFGGVDATPFVSGFYDIDFAFQRESTLWYVYEGGSFISSHSATGKPYAYIWRVGTTLYFGIGADFADASAAPLRTVLGVSSKLFFDSSIASVGVKFEALFLDMSATSAVAGYPTGVYRSLQSGNLGHNPVDSAWWAPDVPTYAAWSPTAHYELGARITDTIGHRIYESGWYGAAVAISIASPGVVSLAAHGFAAEAPIVFATTGELPTGIVAGTVYYVKSPIADSFNVSATPGGAAINTSGSQFGAHTVYTAPNIAKDPATRPDYWFDIGPANRWAMFDSVVGTRTVSATLIDVTLELTGRADSLALLEMENAVSVQIIVTTVAEGEVYNETFDLTATEGVGDWYAYFTEDIDRKTNLLVTELPSVSNPTVQVIIEGSVTAQLAIGLFVVGQAFNLGRTLHDGASVGIFDYSRKEVDDFGNVTVVPRAFSKRGSFQNLITKAQVDGVQSVLAAYRATPAVYSASEDYDATLIFGFVKDFQIEIAYPNESLVSLEIEGLT